MVIGISFDIIAMFTGIGIMTAMSSSDYTLGNLFNGEGINASYDLVYSIH